MCTHWKLCCYVQGSFEGLWRGFTSCCGSVCSVWKGRRFVEWLSVPLFKLIFWLNHSEVHNPSLCFLGIVLVKSLEKVTRLLFEPAIPDILRFKQRLFLKKNRWLWCLISLFVFVRCSNLSLFCYACVFFF